MTTEQENRLAELAGKMVYNISELTEMCYLKKKRLRQEIDSGKKAWGRWTYNKNEPPSIDLCGHYEIVLDRIDTDAKLGTWLLHLAEKGWVTSEDLGNLVMATMELEWIGYHRLKRTQSGC